MAETEDTAAPSGSDTTDGAPLAYKAPAPKSLKEIQELDKDDESLAKYKKSLLGEGVEAEATGEGPKVTLQELALIVEDHDDIVLDLTGDLAKLKEKTYLIKEGIVYKAKLTFVVENDIVAGLKYVQVSHKTLAPSDTSTYMLGSYAPKKEAHVFTAPVEEFAKGMLARGHYTVQSKFLDDDGREFLSWEWAFDLKKDWE
ncbi:rho GDP-dissociation inhibitor 2-like [Patiria miniata]|uniref:Rho GDP-dissociation inhibitor 3 n=1 Tax=Patiria miniata TaxID=46514 RepID=A0A913ZQ30_PATMI|nr:rho GDP-dissociation inhibitor 2-like [Patiria miniata]XP_038053239.1 rho GDP-dissociation inhibitor 2-like [Patiria miniata]XP_038053240.1 rho GDP-dissociation inhibitor 2-like [Patiria miniata]XP_038063736.1 rho GDP-dissociation inhibitor 2-like [Patiria miniata]XP_038063737.1 rho GDP-dissociation inhibitor 2-like [Patiria miniata]XP_038063738.1 rho GDP-dissociation inhibitor 2-like [Patiria miniata]XP_038063739.1 rho GDP-dissociation inhibitor 2-like [Patiria miniata]